MTCLRSSSRASPDRATDIRSLPATSFSPGERDRLVDVVEVRALDGANRSGCQTELMIAQSHVASRASLLEASIRDVAARIAAHVYARCRLLLCVFFVVVIDARHYLPHRRSPLPSQRPLSVPLMTNASGPSPAFRSSVPFMDLRGRRVHLERTRAGGLAGAHHADFLTRVRVVRTTVCVQSSALPDWNGLSRSSCVMHSTAGLGLRLFLGGRFEIRDHLGALLRRHFVQSLPWAAAACRRKRMVEVISHKPSLTLRRSGAAAATLKAVSVSAAIAVGFRDVHGYLELGERGPLSPAFPLSARFFTAEV